MRAPLPLFQVLLPYSLAYFSSIHLDNPAGSCTVVWCVDIQIPTIPSRASITGRFNPFHMMGGRYPGRALLSTIHGVTVENTLYEDGEQAKHLGI